MSAAPAAEAAPAEGETPKKGKKKLIIIGAAVAVLLAGGGGAFFMMKSKADAEAAAAAEGEDGEDGAAEHAAQAKSAKKAEHDKEEHKGPPTFVPLDPFVVNLADKDGERFAQVGISLQVGDAHMAEEMKGYMPAIRNAVLLLLSHKTSEELLTIEGKHKLAEEIRRDAARAMGIDVEDPEDEEATAKDEEEPPKKKKKKKKKVEVENPIAHVHYSNFIIQ